MAELGKVALWALPLISVWIVCTASSHGTDFDQVQKNGYLKGLYSSDESTRWLADLASQSSKISTEISQARRIDLPKDTRDAKSFQITEDDTHKDYPSELPFSDTDISEDLANIENMEKPFHDFVMDKLSFITSKNIIATSKLEKRKDIFLATSSGEKVITEHVTSSFLSPGIPTTTADNNKSSKTHHSGTLEGHKPGRYRVKASHIKLIPQRVILPVDVSLLETQDFKHVQGKKFMKYRKSDLRYRKSDVRYRKSDLRYRKSDLAQEKFGKYRKSDLRYRKSDLAQEKFRKYRKSDLRYRKSDLAEEKSHLTMTPRFLKTNVHTNRKKRNTPNEHPYMKTNENENDSKSVHEDKLDHFVINNTSGGHNLESTSHTEMADVFNDTDQSVHTSNDKNSKINNDDLDDSKVDVEYREGKDVGNDVQSAGTSVWLLRGNNNTTTDAAVLLNKTSALSLGAVTQSTMHTNSSARYDTLISAIDYPGHISSAVPSLSESISPTTPSLPLSMDNTESVFTTNVPDISISTEMVYVYSQYQENKNYPEATTSFGNTDLYKGTLDSETTRLTVESEIATSGDSDYISPEVKVGFSTPFSMDTIILYTTDIHTIDISTKDAHTTVGHITDYPATDGHTTDATTTDAPNTDVHSTDATTTDVFTPHVHTTYVHTTDAHTTDDLTTVVHTPNVHTTDVPSTLNIQTEHESVSSDFSPDPTLLPISSSDSLDTNSFTTPSVNLNFSQSVPELDNQITHFPPNADGSNIYHDNGSVDVTKSEDSNNFPLAEARLDWELAKQTWQYAWEIHVYAFGCLFGLVGLYTTVSFVRLWWIKCLFPKGYFISVHALVVFMCCTRSFYLLYDAYGSGGTIHAGLNHFLYSVSFPCMTSTFGLLFFSLLRATQGQLVSPSIQKIQVLVFLIVVHFLISMTADVLMCFYTDLQVVQFVCHVYFITWGSFLFIGYIFVFPKLRRLALKRQNDGIYTSPCTTNGKVKSSLTLSASIKAMFCAAVCGVVVVAMEVYAIIQVYKTFTRGQPEPWTWWLYHTVLRTIEVVVCLTLSYAVSLPFRYRRPEHKCSCGVFCAPCSEIFCSGYDLNNPNSNAGFSHCEQEPNYENGDNLTENCSKKLLYNHLTDIIPTFDIQPTFGSRPNSLLIVEDGYVRFQTDYDINRIVDSCNDLSQRPADVKNVSTFLRGDGCVNTGYSLHSREDTSNNNNLETDLTDKPRKSSITNSDFFRVPSSVSLADSMENEISKAFESFKMDASEGEQETKSSTNHIETSNFRNTQETDLVSLSSNPESGAKSNMATQNQSKPTYRPDGAQRKHDSDNQLVTLPRTAKSPDVYRTLKDREFLSDQNMQQSHRHCSVDGDRTLFSVTRDPPSAKYFCLVTDDKTGTQLLGSEDGDLDNDIEFHVPVRRPSEGQGSQAVVLTSLLNSWESAANENIDV